MSPTLTNHVAEPLPVGRIRAVRLKVERDRIVVLVERNCRWYRTHSVTPETLGEVGSLTVELDLWDGQHWKLAEREEVG